MKRDVAVYLSRRLALSLRSSRPPAAGRMQRALSRRGYVRCTLVRFNTSLRYFTQSGSRASSRYSPWMAGVCQPAPLVRMRRGSRRTFSGRSILMSQSLSDALAVELARLVREFVKLSSFIASLCSIIRNLYFFIIYISARRDCDASLRRVSLSEFRAAS